MLSDIIQRLNNPQAQLLPLLPLFDGNILDVADQAEGVDELALDNQAAGADDAAFTITDDQEVVLVVAGGDPVIALVPLLLRDVADSGQHAQDVEVAAVEVRAADRTNDVVLRKGSKHVWGDEGGREEGGVVNVAVAVQGSSFGCGERCGSGAVGVGDVGHGVGLGDHKESFLRLGIG